MHCINKNSPEYSALLKKSNLKQPILDSYIMVWQEKNGIDRFPTLQELNIKPLIKEGVSELFDSNPELANAVYEALGFKSKESNVNSEAIEKLKGKIKALRNQDGSIPDNKLSEFKSLRKQIQFLERNTLNNINNTLQEFINENNLSESEAKYLRKLATIRDNFQKLIEDYNKAKGTNYNTSELMSFFNKDFNLQESIKNESQTNKEKNQQFEQNLLKDNGFEANKDYTANDLDEFVEKHGSKQVKFIWNLIKAVAQKLGVTTRFMLDGTHKIPENAAGHYFGGKIENRASLLSNPESAVRIIVHELVHGVTTYILKAVEQNNTKVLSKLTSRQLKAVEKLNKLFEELKKDKEFDDTYGTKNTHELLAELTNESFTDKLKAKNIFEKILEAIFEIFNVPFNAYNESIKILEDLISNPIKENRYEGSQEENFSLYAENDNQITPQQKLEAQQKFQEYVNATGKQDLEGFKKYVETPQITRGNINYYEEPGFKKRNPNFNPDIYVNQAGKFTVEKEYPELAPTLNYDLTSLTSTEASEEVLNLIKDFMKNAGISQTKIENYAISHNTFGIADPIKNLVAVVEGMENVTLPEEAIHVAVAIIKEVKPEIYNKLIQEVTSYKLYGEVLKEYKDVYTKNGKPDLIKIKEEAVAKLLVEQLISNIDGNIESKQKLEQIKSIWQTIKDYLFSLFRKTGFQQALETILDNELDAKEITKDSGHFYSLSQQDIANKVEEIHQKSSQQLSDTLKDREGNSKNVYIIDEKEMSRRVSDAASESYNRLQRNGDLSKSEYQKMVDDLKAENGTFGHADAQHIVEYLTDENGRFVDKPFDEDYIPKTNKEVYTKLFNFLYNKLQQYPESIIKAERRVINEKDSIGGTIDILIFQPDGTVQILDWKFNELDPSKSKDIPWYKKNSWDIQLRGYKKILSEAYGIPYSKIKAEIIPIRTIYKYFKGGKAPILYNIEIGSSDVSSITKDYLLPYQESRQSTGKEDFDKLISRLNSLTEDITKIDVKGNPERKYVKAEQLNAIQKSIRHIQAKQSLTPFVEQANLYMKDVENLINRYEELKDINLADKAQFTILNNFGHEVEYALSQLPKYQKIAVLFNDLEDETLLNELKQISANADILDSKLRDKVLKPIVEKIADSQNVEGINATEAQINMINRNFVETSNLDTASMQLMYKLVKQAHNERDFKLDEKLKEFTELSKQFKKEDSNLIFRKDNTLIRQYSKDFYKELKDKVLNKDKEWLYENVDMDKYLEKIDVILKEQISYVEARPYTEEQKNEEISKLKDKYNPKNNGLWHTNYLKQFPLSKWESEEWKKMRANESVSKMYDFMVSFNKYASNIGYLDKESSWKHFLPFVRKGFAEALYNGGELQFWDRFLSAVTVDSDDYLFGQKDENGQPIYKLMKPFTNKLREGKETSEDYLSNFGNYIKAVYNYSTLSEIEGFVSLIKQNEQAKKSLAINNIGNTIIDVDTGRLKELETNLINTETFVKHQANLIYGQKYTDGSDTDTSLGKVGELANKINNATEKYFNTTLISKNIADSSFSMNKTINLMNKVFQIKVLGFAPFPALSNLIGGTLQNMVSSGIFFTKADMFTGSLSGILANIGSEEGKKFIAAMNYFMPFVHNQYNEKALRHLSSLKLTPHDVQNFIMFGMRGSDLAVQFQIFAGLWKNMIVKDGKIMNARLLKHLGEDVNVEELIKEYGIAKHSRIEDGKLLIDGIDRNSKTVYEQRDLSQSLAKRATGTLTSAEVRGANLNVYTDSMMIFKNWIPALTAQRFKKLSKPADLPNWEWGRAATMASVIGFNFKEASTFFIDSLAMLTGFNPQLSKTGKIINNPSKASQVILELYEKKKLEWMKQTGKSAEEFKLTQEEFTNLLRQNMLSAARELGYLTILLSAFFMLKALPPDEDELTRNKMKSLQRLADKISDEMAFYYSPASLVSITNGNLIPSIGLLTDASKIMSHSFKEIWGLTYGENGMLGVDVDDNQVIKYWLKAFPVSSQFSSFMPIVMPDLAKYLGIKVTPEARR